MDEHATENQALWNAWSDEFQAMWNLDTADGELPPAPFPLEDAQDADWFEAIAPPMDEAAFAELGCGGGQATVGAAMAGVDSAVGVDFSREQLQHARHLRRLYGVDASFALGDVTSLPLADDAVDVAFSGWVYFMVADLDAALAEAHRVLREGGLFVFDRPHPFYEIFDAETMDVVRSYHASGPRRNEIDEAFEPEMIVYDRSVSELCNALVEAGFEVARMQELPDHDDPDEYREDDPIDSNRPDLMAKVPRSVRFWAVARA